MSGHNHIATVHPRREPTQIEQRMFRCKRAMVLLKALRANELAVARLNARLERAELKLSNAESELTALGF